MPGTARKSKKTPVAKRATPDQQVRQCPPPEALKSLLSAKAVLSDRHAVLSWDVIAYELGRGIDRGTLSRVANGKRDASAELIARINSAYGTHLHYIPRKVPVDPCPTCGTVTVAETCPVCHPPKPKRTRKPDPVVRWNRVDAARIAALSALYAQRGIGEARYRVALKRELDDLTG